MVSAGLVDPIFVLGRGNFPFYEDRRGRWELIIYQNTNRGKVTGIYYAYFTSSMRNAKRVKILKSVQFGQTVGNAREASE
jgi:hypothetical protein